MVMEKVLNDKTSADTYYKKFPSYIYGTKARMIKKNFNLLFK